MVKVVKDTEDLFRGGFSYSEAAVCSIHSNFETDVPEEVIAVASGFPIGIERSKCLCGAVSGSIMATGLVFGHAVQKDPQVGQILALSEELHDWFKTANGENALYCRIFTKEFDMGAGEHKEQCTHFTGLMASRAVEITTREKGLADIDG